MLLLPGVETVLRCYPRIYFACHMRHVRDDQAKRTLSAHQASILDHLDEVAPTLVHELASHMGVTPSTISIHLDRLERYGYVRRARDTEDARKVHVRLTRAGVRIKQKQKVLDPERVDEMLRELPENERKRALEGLELLAAAAQASMGKRITRKAI
jgi:MarR family transcriptional regulator, organic hydroperoxide resistance regulator